MQTVRKAHRRWGSPLLAVSLASFLMFTASGCASQPEAAPKESEVIAEEPSSEAAPVEDACVDDGTVYGSVVVDKLEAGPDGEYCSVKIDPSSPALKVDKERVSDDVYAEGYTDADVEKALSLTISYLVEHVLDNPTAGGQEPDNAANTEWLNSTEATKVFEPAAIAFLLSTYDEGPTGVGRFAILSDGFGPPLVHDKSVRFKNIAITVQSVHMITSNEGVRKLRVEATADTTFRIVPSEANAWAARHDSRMKSFGDTDDFGPFEFDASKPTYLDLPVTTKPTFTKDSLSDNLLSGMGFNFGYDSVKVYN